MDYTIQRKGMTCARHDDVQPIYHKYETKSGNIWLVPTNFENKAEYIIFHNPKDKNSQGYAGSTLEFTLDDGTVYSAKGPWHSNSDDLFEATGVDVRNTYYTFVVLSKDIEYGKHYETIMKDVVYIDKEPTMGLFNRKDELIKLYPEARYYYSETRGGSSMGPISGRSPKTDQTAVPSPQEDVAASKPQSATKH